MKTGRLMFAIVLFFLISPVHYAQANLGICNVNTLPAAFSPNLASYSTAFGNGKFVAVGDDGSREKGVIITSADGKNWTVSTSETFYVLRGVTYGNGTFVAVGDYGSVVTSPDGVIWTIVTTRTFYQIKGVTYGNGTFVAVGDDGLVLTSPDGVNWTDRVAGTIESLNGVTYGDGSFVAVGTNGAILRSFDGIDWTPPVSGLSDFHSRLNAVAYGNGMFVAVGYGLFITTFYPVIVTSPDGANWTTGSVSTFEHAYYYDEVAFGYGTFVLRGQGNFGIILTSSDGGTWDTRATFGSGTGVRGGTGIAFGNNTFIVGPSLQCDPFSQQPFPEIKANGYISIPGGGFFGSNDVLSLTIGLDTVGPSVVDADWWVVAYAPFGIYYYVYPGQWNYAPSLEDVRPAYQGPLFDLSQFEVLNITGLPVGLYAFYFGVDTDMNGLIDFDKLYLDSVLINIMP